MPFAKGYLFISLLIKSMNIKFQSNLLWGQFLNAFIQCIPYIQEHENLLLFNKSRTSFYNSLFEKVFNIVISNYDNIDKRFHYRKENFHRVDFSLIFQPKHKIHQNARWEIPIILIESENNPNPDNNYQEIQKLCLLNAPLKILFICTNWKENRWDLIDGYWNAIIEGYIENIEVKGIFGIFILDLSNNSKCFYYHKLVENNRFNSKTKAELFCNRIEF